MKDMNSKQYPDNLKYWVWLSVNEALKPKAKLSILQYFGSPEAAFNSPDKSFRNVEGLSRSELKSIGERDISASETIINQCISQGIEIITYDDKKYPERLKSIYDPPILLYVKGSLPDVDNLPLISVIGTRKADDYGMKMAFSIAYRIAVCGGVVVSGLTAGADCAAWKGAVRAGGKCVAVLGTSHDNADSGALMEICANGAAVSEYAPGTKSLRKHFRARNRITAGLSLGVVVAQAPEKSGTMLFVAEALDQGKDVYAVPGNADSLLSTGALALLKDGATPATDGWSILSEYIGQFPNVIHKDNSAIPEFSLRTFQYTQNTKAPSMPSCTESNVSNTKIASKDSPIISSVSTKSFANEVEQAIACALSNGPLFTDEIITLSALPTAKVISALTVMEIKGIISHGPGKQYFLK